ncbi:hypothetical protein GRF29_216g652684, partial [Pseudopithomyces chartarum]
CHIKQMNPTGATTASTNGTTATTTEAFAGTTPPGDGSPLRGDSCVIITRTATSPRGFSRNMAAARG